LTLFHHLPGAEHAAIDAKLAELCQDEAPAPFHTTGLRFLGRGTAYTVQMPAVAALRKRLADMWQPWLTAQDRQPWQPHITVQNKVAPDIAKRMHQALRNDFSPHYGLVTGISVWRYLGGPWESSGDRLFRAT
jgi:hypothetical protein